MQTRRVFLKTLLALGAVLLPWSQLPKWFGETLQNGLGHPSVNLVRSSETDLNTGAKTDDSLSRTAMDDISVLTRAEMKGRAAGSAGEAKAAQYLTKQLSALGLNPMGDRLAGFGQAFTIPPMIVSRVNGRVTFKPRENQDLRTPCVNLLGGLIGENNEEIIVLSAHYDHLGIFEDRIYPGANDNAAGVGCILDVMRRIIREGKTPKRTIILCFWSAEEMGFIGSQAFVQSPLFPLEHIQAVLNADTIGNGVIGDFMMWANGENVAVRAIRQAADETGASAILTPAGGHNSDSFSFASANIPSVTLVTRDWLNKNHTPDDTISNLKQDQITKATEIMYQAVQILAF